MLLVALAVLGVAAFLFGAGFAVGCSVTRAVTDDDVMTAIEYEHKRTEQIWQRLAAAEQPFQSGGNP